MANYIEVEGAGEHNLKGIDVSLRKQAMTVITGVSGSGKSSLAFDTILAEAQRRFFSTLSYFARQFVHQSVRPKVKRISGLSPAMSLAQFEQEPSVRAVVATQTELGELFGILFSGYGKRFCPTHDVPTDVQTLDLIIKDIFLTLTNELVALTVAVIFKPKESKKSKQKKIEAFATKGYARCIENAKMRTLDELALQIENGALASDSLSEIHIVVDMVDVMVANNARILASLKDALQVGGGRTMVWPLSGSLNVLSGHQKAYDTAGGCAMCGFVWDALEPRDFAVNGSRPCVTCAGRGILARTDDDDVNLSEACGACQGVGISPEMKWVKFAGQTCHDIYLMPIDLLQCFMQNLKPETPGQRLIFEAALDVLDKIIQLGLGYLSLGRRIVTLSGGEFQRLKLSSILASKLTGVLYVLDEPSQGLHPTEVAKLCRVFDDLCKSGNTLIIVDHDEDVLRHAETIIDLGPGGGRDGGRVVAQFAPENAAAYAHISKTAHYLCTKSPEEPKRDLKPKSFFSAYDLKRHNIDITAISFATRAINVVCGVSGAGKSTLVCDLVRRAAQLGELKGDVDFDGVVLVDRKPLARSNASMLATYLDVFGEIRTLYGGLKSTQLLGLDARAFSLNAKGGRCEACSGRGYQVLSLRFLADSEVECPTCHGKRFGSWIDQVCYLDKSLVEVLAMTLAEASFHFSKHKSIVKKLSTALDLGLGYLLLGQTTRTLSGGEAQRLKLAFHFSNKIGKKLILLDEPTRGLHAYDVAILQNCLAELVGLGHSLIVIEHMQEMITSADWVIEVGPGAAANGGRLVFEGTYEDYVAHSLALRRKSTKNS